MFQVPCSYYHYPRGKSDGQRDCLLSLCREFCTDLSLTAHTGEYLRAADITRGSKYDIDEAKANTPAASWGCVANGLARKKENVEYLHQYYSFDIDGHGGRYYTEDEIRAIFSGTSCIYYTTASSQPDAPKWRVFAPLTVSFTIEDWNRYRNQIIVEIEKLYGIKTDGRSNKDITRYMYLPNPTIGAAPGRHFIWGELSGYAIDSEKLLAAAKKTATIKSVSVDSVRRVAASGVGVRTTHRVGSSDATSLLSLPANDKYRLVKQLLETIQFETGDNEKWVSVAADIHAILGDSGRELFTWWHLNSCPDYHPMQEESMWRWALQNPNARNGGGLFVYADDVVVKKVMADAGKINGGDTGGNWLGGVVPAKCGTATGLPYEYENAYISSWRVYGNQLGSTEEFDSGIFPGCIPVNDHSLVVGQTGKGKTTFLANLALDYSSRETHVLGRKRNVFIVSMESNKRMYWRPILRAAVHHGKNDPVIGEKLQRIFDVYGDLWKDWGGDFEEGNIKYISPMHEKIVKRYMTATGVYEPRTVFNKNYSEEVQAELEDILFGDGGMFGRIHIHDYHQPMSSEEIAAAVEESEQELGIEYDVLVVDYVQILKHGRADENSIEGFKDAVNELVRYCDIRGMTLLGAAQAIKRYYAAWEAMEVDVIAESKSVSNCVANVIGVQQSKYDREYCVEHKKGVLRLNVIKSRSGRPTNTNTECMLIVEQRGYTIEDLMACKDAVALYDKAYKKSLNSPDPFVKPETPISVFKALGVKPPADEEEGDNRDEF